MFRVFVNICVVATLVLSDCLDGEKGLCTTDSHIQFQVRCGVLFGKQGSLDCV